MKLKETTYIINEIIQKGKTEGLTVQDYRYLRKIQKSISCFLVADDLRWSNLYYEIEKLIQEIYQSEILHTISRENCEYIERKSLLLPLVLANSTDENIRIYSDNSYRFKCQFHMERTPSMGVSDIKNVLFCYGCGASLNSISYIEKYEQLNYKDTIQLLAQTFLIDINQKNLNLEDKVKKYQDTILSEEYLKLLEVGKKRLQERYDITYNGKSIEKWYEDRYNMIERIKSNTYDPNFINEEPKKIMYLR